MKNLDFFLFFPANLTSCSGSKTAGARLQLLTLFFLHRTNVTLFPKEWKVRIVLNLDHPHQCAVFLLLIKCLRGTGSGGVPLPCISAYLFRMSTPVIRFFSSNTLLPSPQKQLKLGTLVYLLAINFRLPSIFFLFLFFSFPYIVRGENCECGVCAPAYRTIFGNQRMSLVLHCLQLTSETLFSLSSQLRAGS